MGRFGSGGVSPMTALRSLIPLLIAAGLLLAGNSLQGTLIALRGAHEGFSASLIGLIGATYFGGFLAGCILIPRLLQMVGHIRAFCAMAALSASATITLFLIIDPIAWLILRFVSGACFASMLATTESWINSSVTNQYRGKMLSIYRLVDLGFVTGAQYLIPVFGFTDVAIFGIMTILIVMSLFPISIGDRSNPPLPPAYRFSAKTIWRISPLACIGCVAIGLTGAAFRIIGPLYADSIGLSVADVANFMSAGIIGGAVLQYPLGWLSDRFDRRVALLLATAGAAGSGLFLTLFAQQDPWLNLVGIFLFGAFSLPLYSLSAAHANDFAKQDEFVQVASGLMFFWACGAIIGPLLSSVLMQLYSPAALFSFTSLVHGALIVITLWRMRARATVPRTERGRFVTLLRTSPMMARLAGRSGGKKSSG